MPFHHSTNKPKQLNFQTLNIDIDAFMILLNPSGNNEVRNRSIIPSSYSIPTNIFMNAFLFSKHAWERKAINNYYWKCTKKIYCSSNPSLHVCGDVFCFLCVFLRCNEQVAWMKCSLSSGVMQLYFFLPLLIRVINRVDSGIIERKGKNEIHGNIWMQIAAFNPFLLKAIISLAIDILDVKRLLFSQHELSICLSISLASSKKQLVIQ